MPFLARIVAFFLIPCLIVNPAEATAFALSQPKTGSQADRAVLFNKQALTLPLVTQEEAVPVTGGAHALMCRMTKRQK